MTLEAQRRHSAPAERNKEPILAQLQRLLGGWPTAAGHQHVLVEVASGSGQHAAHCSVSLAGWQWLPTDPAAEALSSIRAWCADLPNVLPAMQLDVLQSRWLGLPTQVDAMFCANMIHIAPWACTAALMQGAARHLAPHGLLITYGPYLEDDTPTSPGNVAFDADLRQRNPAWGIRRREDVEREAAAAGLALQERVAMPANNLLLAWGRG